MLEIPRLMQSSNFKMNPKLTPTIVLQSDVERMFVFPGILKADLLGDAENPTSYRAQL